MHAITLGLDSCFNSHEHLAGFRNIVHLLARVGAVFSRYIFYRRANTRSSAASLEPRKGIGAQVSTPVADGVYACCAVATSFNPQETL